MLSFFQDQKAILGMNARNLDYVRPYNHAKGKRIADQKLLCKRVLKQAGIPVPGLIAKIKDQAALDAFDWNTLPNSFALKPNRGFGGEGILVVYARKKNHPDTWVKADGSTITVDYLKNHIRNIHDGSFSLSNSPDVAFFEERLKLSKILKPYTYKGIPDIRVIIFNRVPVMAMLRLPTVSSGGKANLQQGAIGVGIDMANGTTTTAIIGKGKRIEYVPGTRLLLSGIKIPRWKDILNMAVTAQDATGLGFLGADVAIDRDLGAVILELNARPGLSIQLANVAGLKERLERVRGLKIKSVDHGVRVGMNLFGGEIEENIEELSGKHVIGSIEKVKFIGKNDIEIEVEAKIDTGADSSSIDRRLAEELGFGEALAVFESIPKPAVANREEASQAEEKIRKEISGKHPDLADVAFVYSSNGFSFRPKINLTLLLDKQEILAKPTIVDRSSLHYRAIIGRRNLGSFLVDVSKK